jgi:hypothetical protein
LESKNKKRCSLFFRFFVVAFLNRERGERERERAQKMPNQKKASKHTAPAPVIRKGRANRGGGVLGRMLGVAKKVPGALAKRASQLPGEALKIVKRKALGGDIKDIVKRAKQTVAAGRLASRIVTGAPEIALNLVTGKGLTLPGTNYLGPGNPMGRKVMSKTDALAKTHDEAYGRYLAAGYSKKQVYGGFSESDKRLMKAADTTTPEGLAAYGGMKAKWLGEKARRGIHGILGTKAPQRITEATAAAKALKNKK